MEARVREKERTTGIMITPYLLSPRAVTHWLVGVR